MEDIAEKRIVTLSSEVDKWLMSANGIFMSTDIIKDLHLATRPEKQNLSIILKRRCDDGVIERYGGKNGLWKKKDLTVNKIDWQNANSNGIKIKFPFEIEKLYVPQSKNIIVVAGAPDGGKTAFMLNVVALNALSFPIRYQSSEMGANELKSRISLFEDTEPFQYCEFEERSFDFHDRVEPDSINIIDYIEMSDQFYLIGDYIKKIFDKLNEGIAIIAIQKNTGAENPRGGEIAKEKARLVLNLDYVDGVNRAKITKCKNWANPLVNPNRKVLEYKLHMGSTFQTIMDWASEESIKQYDDERRQRQKR